jgi:hypothetical protein
MSRFPNDPVLLTAMANFYIEVGPGGSDHGEG